MTCRSCLAPLADSGPCPECGSCRNCGLDRGSRRGALCQACYRFHKRNGYHRDLDRVITATRKRIDAEKLKAMIADVARAWYKH